MNTLGLIVIKNVDVRRAEGAFLKRMVEIQAGPLGVPVEICVDDTGLLSWGNFRRCLNVPGNTGTHRMIMQDDITLDRRTIEKAMHILKYAPENAFVSIYAPDNTDFQECYFSGHHVLKSPINFWLQCCIYPDCETEPFLKWVDEYVDPNQKGDDCRVSIWMQRNKRMIYSVVPGLVQHLGAWRSSLGFPGKVGKHKRWSKWYDAGLDVYNIDWAEEFRNPYIAQMKSTLYRILIK